MAGACSSTTSVKKGMCLSDSLPRIFMENGYCLSRAHLSGCFWVVSSSKRRWMRLELWGPETRCWMKLWHCAFLLFPVGGLLKLVSFRSKGEHMVWDVAGVTWVDWAANALSVKASTLLCTKMKARPSKRLQGIMLCHVMSFHIPLTSFSYFRVHCFWNEHADEAMVQCCRMRQLRILCLTGVAATVIMIFGSETPMGPAAASPIELRSAGAMPYPIDVVFVHGFLDMNSPP